MAAPVIALVDTPTPTESGTSIVVDSTTGSPAWATNDIILVVVHKRNLDPATATGMTSFGSVDNATDGRLECYYRYWQGGDTTFTFNWTGSVDATAYLYRVTGGPTSGDPSEGLNTALTVSNTPEFDCPDGGAGLVCPVGGGTFTQSDNLLVMFGGSEGQQATYTGADITTANGVLGTTTHTAPADVQNSGGSPATVSKLAAWYRQRTGSTASFLNETRGSTARDHNMILFVIPDGAAASVTVPEMMAARHHGSSQPELVPTSVVGV